MTGDDYDTVLPGRGKIVIFMFRGAPEGHGALPAVVCPKNTAGDISVDISEKFVYKHSRH